MDEKIDAIVIGAGPAGIAAAYTMAKAGLEVIVFERGEYPGSKNVMGGILYSTVLNNLIPNFLEDAPIERHITTKKFSLLSEDSELAFSFRSEEFNSPPFNNSFTVLRAKFDQWLAAQAEEVGAMIISETVVDDVIQENGKVVGVKARRDEGELYSDVVICAEGVNSLIARKIGLRERFTDEQIVLAVKEIIDLPEEVIQDRFCLAGNEGTAIEYFGSVTKGMVGSGFIYTNKDSLSIGVGCDIASLKKTGVNPNDLLDDFKTHPCVKNLLRGGEIKELSAHAIPEGGYEKIPKLVADGFILAGDAAGLVNTSLYHEGSNLAMASGVMAAETVIEAKGSKSADEGQAQSDFSVASLSSYVERLENSFVLKDMQKYSKLPSLILRNPQYLDKYPRLFAEMAKDFFTISERTKEEAQQEMKETFKSRVSKLRFLWDMNRLRRALT